MASEWRSIAAVKPQLEHRRCLKTNVEMFRNVESGFSCVLNMSELPNGPLPPHMGFVRHGKAPHFSLWNEDALNLEKKFMQRNPPRLPALCHEDWYDTKTGTYAVGGARRHMVSRPLMQILKDGDDHSRKLAFQALRKWNEFQITHRPFGFWPWGFDEKDPYTAWLIGYERAGGDGRIKAKGPDGIERNAWDIAHLETTPQFALAALGDDLGLVTMWLLWRWFGDCYHERSFWLGSNRKIGWSLVGLTRAAMLGLIPDPCGRGYTPLQQLQQHVDVLCGREAWRYTIGESDARHDELPQLEEYNRNELQGIKPIMSGFMIHGATYALETDLLNAGQRSGLASNCRSMAKWLWDKARPTQPNVGLPWCCGLTAFSLEEAHDIQKLCQERYDRKVFLHPVDGGWTIRNDDVSSFGEDEMVFAYATAKWLPENEEVTDYADTVIEECGFKDEHEDIMQPLRRVRE